VPRDLLTARSGVGAGISADSRRLVYEAAECAGSASTESSHSRHIYSTLNASPAGELWCSLARKEVMELSVNMWFVVVPWLAFAVGLVGFCLRLRRSPRGPRPFRSRRRTPRNGPEQAERSTDHDPDLSGFETSSV
jgi:hypothetical protein